MKLIKKFLYSGSINPVTLEDYLNYWRDNNVESDEALMQRLAEKYGPDHMLNWIALRQYEKDNPYSVLTLTGEINPASEKSRSTKFVDAVENTINSNTLPGGLARTFGAATLGATALTNLPITIGGLVGGKLIDKATGGFGNLVENITGIDSRIGDFFNPGYFIGGKYGRIPMNGSIKFYNRNIAPVILDIYGTLRYPTHRIVYHGSPYPFNIKEARMGSPYDMGLHFGTKEVANLKAGNVKYGPGVRYKVAIPREDATTTDLGSNGIWHLERDLKIVDRNAGHSYSPDWNKYGKKGIEAGVDWNSKDPILMGALRKSGKENVNWVLDDTKYSPDFKFLRTDGNTEVHINPRSYITKKLSSPLKEAFDKEANRLLLEFEKLPKEENLLLPNDSYRTEYNTKAANLLHKYGINSVKYYNRNPIEGLNYSWFVTDPSVIKVLPSFKIPLIQ